jgi:hypothetical protein
MFLNGEKLRKSAMKTQIIGTNKKNIKQTQEKEWGGADGERQKKKGGTRLRNRRIRDHDPLSTNKKEVCMQENQ